MEQNFKQPDMKKTILFVLRDLVPTRIAIRLIRKFKAAGHIVEVIAEGRAVEELRGAGIDIRHAGDNNLDRFIGAEPILSKISPHIVVVGCSFPINWELEFAQAARSKNIPVAAIVDIWGGLQQRLQGFIPDLALVIDAAEVNAIMGAKLAQKAVVIGDIASQADITMSEKKRQWLDQVCDGKSSVLIVGDSKANVEEIVTWTVQAMNRVLGGREYYRIFGSFVHPKEKDAPENKGLLTRIHQMLSSLQFIEHDGISIDALAAYCDVTVTCFSTPGRIALHNGKRFVSIAGPDSLTLLKDETGQAEFELVRRRIVPALDEVQPFSYWINPLHEQKGRMWVATAAFNVNAGGDAILRTAI
ncbi:MAG TPA: hypothetical protein VEC13_01215 [Candidatus Paceibacterota bacterium]|nr:hypothetical protein [Candidatus Paceibacterota bacterium]